MKYPNLPKLTLISLFLASCNNKPAKENGRQSIYGKFMIALGEGAFDKVQCVAGFSKSKEDGDQFSLGNSTNIFLDTFKLTFDSVYFPQYDTEIDTSHYLGKHAFKISNQGENKEYTFVSKPFKIVTDIPSIVGKEDIKVNCNSIQSSDKVDLLIGGDYSDNSETIIDITPSDGYFIIPKTVWQKVEGSNLYMWFNLTSVKNIEPDNLLTLGGKIEATRVSKHYDFKIEK